MRIDSFKEEFKDYTDYYTIIGGAACDILLTEADLPLRATKDINMILIMEDNFSEFTAGTKVESEGHVTGSILASHRDTKSDRNKFYSLLI